MQTAGRHRAVLGAPRGLSLAANDGVNGVLPEATLAYSGSSRWALAARRAGEPAEMLTVLGGTVNRLDCVAGPE